jgi:pimeloyl-ACP methyl ester carboxylesterase
LKEWSIVDHLPEIDVPCLILNGPYDLAQDFVVAPLFWGIPRSKWLALEGTSHSPQWEARARTMDAVRTFVASAT